MDTFSQAVAAVKSIEEEGIVSLFTLEPMTSLANITRHIDNSARLLALRLGLSHPRSEPVQAALRKTFRNDATPEERAWVERIETLRSELNSSSDPIDILDFGAGDPNSTLTAGEMYEGRAARRTIGEISRASSKRSFWAFLLFRLIRELKPKACLELGTSVGISASYQAAALTLNGAGALVTLEGAPALASKARTNFEALGLRNVRVVSGRFQDTLPRVLEEMGQIDYAFIDGHHDERATIDYFHQIEPFLSSSSVLVFDDINWSRGMRRAWKAIRSDGAVTEAIDLGSMGLCIMKRHEPVPRAR
ncbi:MAG: class I SAM-dependent methyltransferase [Acidobacteria bacterium]|nr:class I SAM-dependent methyltransferase [Acidobacteriota bacterium]